MIYRYPRYGELFDAWQAQKNSGGASRCSARRIFATCRCGRSSPGSTRSSRRTTPRCASGSSAGRNFTPADQRRMGEKQREIVGQVLPEYRKLAATGQIEISTTPYYHPILPLLCDSNIAGVAHPGVPLPPRFRYPADARRQLALAREYCAQHFGVAPVGLWPSEGSVSDEVFAIAAELGFEWAATDSGVLNRTLGQRACRWTASTGPTSGGRAGRRWA